MYALSITDLIKVYPNNLTALKGISVNVEKGDFFALLGPNGAGKSTTIGIMSCLINKTSGSVQIFGREIDKESHITKTFLGLVPQEFNFNVFEKVFDIVVNQAGYYGIPRKKASERAEYYLKKLDLWHKKESPSRFLSGGMKRKLMIARALIHEPKLLILDEPTAGVDVETRREMWNFMSQLNEKGTTIILTTHYLEEAEKLCKNVAIIDKGAIIENTSVKKLLSRLEKETFILHTKEPGENINKIKGYELKRLDSTSLKIEISGDQSINELIIELNKQNIEIKSMRNISGRLEELFLNLVGKA
ncbi:MAG: ABC transporter ATP-binding protein [Deltaproteobacteria bacterium]|nr:ABC transporter ATP-binding protein [Deltaproteobacteria bacterium]